MNEFWFFIYDYNHQNYANVNNIRWQEIYESTIKIFYPSITFQVKQINIQKNIVDGFDNRLLYQEFMRNPIEKPQTIFSYMPQV